MYDNIPSNITNGIRISVLELPKMFKRSPEEPPKEAHENNVGKLQTKKKENVLQTMITLGLAELVGTALLLFLGCMGCVSTDILPVPHHVPALTFGLSVMLIIQTFGHISGAHLNPAVTISTVLLGLVKPIMAPVYIVAQFVGGLIGFGLLKVLIPAEYTATEVFNLATNQTERKLGLCTTVLHPRMSIMQALAMETLITSVLILVCCAVWDKRNAHNSDSVPLRFGLVIMVIASVAGPYTGASMNPPRSFAPAVFNNDWDDHWVYWVGPILGAFVGTLFYKTVFDAPQDEEIMEDNMEDIPLNEKSERANNV